MPPRTPPTKRSVTQSGAVVTDMPAMLGAAPSAGEREAGGAGQLEVHGRGPAGDDRAHLALVLAELHRQLPALLGPLAQELLDPVGEPRGVGGAELQGEGETGGGPGGGGRRPDRRPPAGGRGGGT